MKYTQNIFIVTIIVFSLIDFARCDALDIILLEYDKNIPPNTIIESEEPTELKVSFFLEQIE